MRFHMRMCLCTFLFWHQKQKKKTNKMKPKWNNKDACLSTLVNLSYFFCWFCYCVWNTRYKNLAPYEANRCVLYQGQVLKTCVHAYAFLLSVCVRFSTSFLFHLAWNVFFSSSLWSQLINGRNSKASRKVKSRTVFFPSTFGS